MKAQISLCLGLTLMAAQLCVPAASKEESGNRIRTERLSARQLKVWKTIENIAKAQDEEARPLHPTLSSLWQRVAMGPHEVYIELHHPVILLSYAAGRFELENCDADRQKCTAVIRLYLPVIDKADLTAGSRFHDGFVPFSGLTKEERYAEVLGHELQHAVCALENPHHAGLMAEMDRQGRELSRLLRQKGSLSPQEKMERIQRLQSLANQIEGPAELAEAEIWKELRESQPVRSAAVQ